MKNKTVQKKKSFTTYRNSVKVVSFQAQLGSNDILAQIQTVQWEVHRCLQLLFPSTLIRKSAGI